MSNLKLYENNSLVRQVIENKPLLAGKMEMETALQGLTIARLEKENQELLKKFLLQAVKELDIIIGIDFDNLRVSYLINLIRSNYNYLRIEEVVYVFQRGILGDFGKMYGKPTVATVLQWFNEYDRQRTEYFENKMEMESSMNKEFRMNTSQLEEYTNRLCNRYTKK